jgi:hypothetical protein
MTSPDPSPELMEVLWEAGNHHGQRLTVAQQVAVGRELASSRPAEITPDSVQAAFDRIGLPTPSAAYRKAVVSRIKKLRPPHTLREVLLDYRQFAIRSLSGQFGGKTTGHEEELRNNLLTYLPQHGFTEARSGRGRTDILLPAVRAIIEVKVWDSVREYEDGLEELGRYIHTDRPARAYMVVFGDREPLPSIISDPRQEIAEERPLEGLAVPVIVVPFEVDQPSRAAANSRRRVRSGR